jgi:hypothetical protein
MLYKPYIDLKIADDSFIKLYLDSMDYNRIRIFKRKELRNQGKKVVVKARTREIFEGDTPFHYCLDLIELKVIQGETLPRPSKFKIQDYD